MRKINVARLNVDALLFLEFRYVPGAFTVPRRLLLLLVIALVPGCSGDTPAPAPTPETPATPQVEQPAKGPDSATSSGHVLAADTEYYIDGPQQSRPPDGTMEAGMKVTVIEDAGSYCRVQTEDGIVAFIAADAVNKVDGADHDQRPV